MPKITFHHEGAASETFEVAEGTNIMRAAVENGVQGIVGECGGQAMCATCHVYVRPDWSDQLPEVSEDEDEMLDVVYGERKDSSRLGCQITVSSDLPEIEVDVPKSQFS